MSNIIPPEFQDFVDHELSTGNYRSAEEIVSDGLRLLRERKLYELRKEIDVGRKQLDRGEAIEIENPEELERFFDDIKQRGRLRMQSQE